MVVVSEKNLKELHDIEVFNWTLEQPFYWQEEVWKLSNAKTLEGYVKFIRKNLKTIKQLQNETTRSNG